MKTPKEIAHLIKTFREANNLTQEQLARKSGVKYYNIMRLERGAVKSPRLEVICLLCEVLEIDLNVFKSQYEIPTYEEQVL